MSLTCYKVVRKIDERYFSVNAPEKYKLEYILGEVTNPAEGTDGIFVFKHQTYAHTFIFNNEPKSLKYHILKCETDELSKIHFRASISSKDIENFWKKFKGEQCDYEWWDAPYGTYLAKNLKPIEVLQYEVL